MNTKNYEPDPEKVAQAAARSKTRAEEYLKDPEKSKRLLDEAMKKANNKERFKGPLGDLWRNLQTLFRLLKAYFNKQYTDIAWGSIVVVVGAIIYFVSPIDLMPDWFPVSGLIDDAAVLMFVIAQIRADLELFSHWETEKKYGNSTEIIDIDLNKENQERK